MKNRTIFFIAVFLISACSEESVRSIDFTNYAGIWVPYEIRYADGTIHEGQFSNKSIFGVYAESIQLDETQTYVPVIWNGIDNYNFKSEDQGKFELVGESKLSFKDGVWDMEFEITKYDGEELWLMYTGNLAVLGGAKTLYKLRREVE